MIISKTPLRISFAGGGSDLPEFYRKFGGAVVTTTIDKFVYVNVNKKFDESIRVGYSRNEEVRFVADVQHPIVRASLQLLGVRGGVEITTIADIPSGGTGLGSSSAFTVGLLNALKAFRGQYSSKGSLAEDSCRIEIDICGDPIGKQDQYATAFGGLNFIEFCADDRVNVSPVICSRDTITALEEQVMLFYTGVSRSAGSILSRQVAELKTNGATVRALQEMVSLSHRFRDELQLGRVGELGAILHEGWLRKRGLTEGISNEGIDILYAKARMAGATGGKILGAGGGGFLMFLAPPDRQEAVKQALETLRFVPVRFEQTGTQIIFYQPTRN